MNRTFPRLTVLLLISLFIVLPAAWASEEDAEAEHVARIEALGRLWGDVLLHHPWIPTRGLDWDAALEEGLRVLQADDTDDGLARAVDVMLGKLGDPMTERQGRDDGADNETSKFPMVDAGDFPSVTELEDGTVVLAVNDHGRFVREFPGSLQAVRTVLTEARSSRRMVLDLRGNREHAGFRDSWLFNLRFRDLLALLSDRDLVMPTLRTRIHNGFRPQRPGGTSGNYYSGFVVPDHNVLAAQAPQDQVPGRLVVLVNSSNSQGYDAVIALRTTGRARVVMDGDGPIDLSQASTRQVAEVLSASIRTGQMLLPDGRTAFEPDARASSAGGESDSALELALDMVRAGWPEDESSSAAKAAPAAPGWFKAYADQPYPSRERRLMGFFRLWTVFDAMHPYLDLIDYSWDDVLTDMIPLYEDAPDALAYHRAVARTMALTQDTHSGARSDVLSEATGRGFPPLRIAFIEDRPVVVHVDDPELPIENGDELVAVDGEPVESVIERQEPYIAYSTPQSFHYRMSNTLVRGDPEGTAELRLRTADGSTKTVEVPLTANAAQVYRHHTKASRPEVIATLEDGTAYVDLVRLDPNDVPQAEQTIRKAGRAILDIRGYPRGTAFSLAPMLAGREYDAAHFERPIRMSLSGRDALYRFDQRFSKRAGFEPFQGKLVVLINEYAISQSEHSCLLIDQAVEDVTFLGSPTQGANGDVTGFRMPGGIQVGFTGQSVSHMDGRQLQRVGVQPDVPVKPTIAGIRAGRDEVLQAALRFLKRH